MSKCLSWCIFGGHIWPKHRALDAFSAFRTQSQLVTRRGNVRSFARSCGSITPVRRYKWTWRIAKHQVTRDSVKGRNYQKRSLGYRNMMCNLGFKIFNKITHPPSHMIYYYLYTILLQTAKNSARTKIAAYFD